MNVIFLIGGCGVCVWEIVVIKIKLESVFFVVI